MLRFSGSEPEVAVVDLASGSASALPVVLRRNTLLDDCGWAADDHVVCSAFRFKPSRGGGFRDSRVRRLFAMDHDGGNPVALVRPPRQPPLVGGAECQGLFREPRSRPWDEHDHLVLDYLPNDPDHVIVASPREHIENFSVYRLNVRNNRLKLDQRYENGLQFWAVDASGNVRLGVAAYNGRKSEFWSHRRMLARDGDGFRHTPTPHLGDPYQLPTILGFTDSADGVFVQARVNGSDRLEVWEFDAATLAPRRPVVADAQHDVRATPIRGGRCGTVGFAYSTSAGPVFTWLDPKFAMSFADLDRRMPDRIEHVHSLSQDCTKAVFTTYGLADRVWHYFDLAAGVVRQLGPERPDASASMATQVSFVARDGTSLYGTLAVPTDRPKQHLPLVVYPHGELHTPRGEPDGWSRFLTDQGYAVFRPWGRGTAGFGETHWHAGFTRRGSSMQSDIADGVASLIEAGVADPGRVCYVGRGYGGYMALVRRLCRGFQRSLRSPPSPTTTSTTPGGTLLSGGTSGYGIGGLIPTAASASGHLRPSSLTTPVAWTPMSDHLFLGRSIQGFRSWSPIPTPVRPSCSTTSRAASPRFCVQQETSIACFPREIPGRWRSSKPLRR